MAHVLIVEDDNQVSALYQRVLNHAGYQTLLVYSAEAAIENLHSFDPDVVYVDWQLADGDCLPFLEKVRQLEAHHRPQILLISANLDNIDLSDYDDLIQTSLPKPVTVNELIWCVGNLAHLAENRTPHHRFDVQILSPKLLKITLAGRLTASVFHELLSLDTHQTEIIILDVQKMDLGDFTRATMTENRRLNALNLKKVYLVYDESSQVEAQYLARFIPRGVNFVYHSNLDQAIHDAMLDE